jgi:hypothetical protein
MVCVENTNTHATCQEFGKKGPSNTKAPKPGLANGSREIMGSVFRKLMFGQVVPNNAGFLHSAVPTTSTVCPALAKLVRGADRVPA